MRVGIAVFLAVATVAGNASSDDTKKAAPAQPDVQSMFPKAGPEQAILKQDVGVWDATVESMMGGPPTVSKGVETNAMMGDLWLITDFRGDFMGKPFLGHGVSGYDSSKKKYVSTWVDSMSIGPQVSESTYDGAKKTMTGSMEGPDPSGKTSKMTSVVEWKDADTRVFTMSTAGPDGKQITAMRITYKRRK
jgi:hypothetical protein